MVSKGHVAQKGTRQMKLAFWQTILDPSGVVFVAVVVDKGTVFVDGKVVDVGVVGGVGSDAASGPVPVVGEEECASFTPFAIDGNKDAEPSAFAFLSASVSVLT